VGTLPLRAVFDHPSLAHLAGRLEQESAKLTVAAPLPVTNRRAYRVALQGAGE
jgi:hypothetical protein